VAGADQHREPIEQAPALGGAQRAPCAVEGAPRGRDSHVDIGCVAARETRKRLAVGRVDHGDRVAARRRGPFVADEVFRFFHACSLFERDDWRPGDVPENMSRAGRSKRLAGAGCAERGECGVNAVRMRYKRDTSAIQVRFKRNSSTNTMQTRCKRTNTQKARAAARRYVDYRAECARAAPADWL
jgi:hypothetical protein